MNHSENIAELAGALAKAQGAMFPAKMDAVNPFLKNRYADLGAVIQAARKPLAENGLSITQHPTVGEGKVSVYTMLMHSSGQWVESEITLPIDNSKGLSLAQSMGVVITYLRRYSLASILGIYADDDADGNEPKQAPRQQSQVNPAAARPLQAPQPINGNSKPAAIVAELVQDAPEEPPVDDEWAKTAPAAQQPAASAYTGKRSPIGKSMYPAEWAAAVAPLCKPLNTNMFEIDGIIQKHKIPDTATAAEVVKIVKAHLAAKAA